MARTEDNVVVSLRLRGPEAVRYWRVLDAAKQRNPYCDKSHVIRELFGLDAPTLITPDELEFFRSGKKGTAKQEDGMRVATETEHPIHLIKDPAIKKRKTG